jgi:DNA repair exonuclease SbcCD ATPase subunit
MNICDRITYQNFLAAGNVPIVVDLTKHATTLVIGKNAAGKSTLHEAICFAWFGRPLRKINKPSLVNWINNRDCLVELDWHLPNGNAYKVRRGIKPAVFEIYKNGIMEPMPANVDDYQRLLESIIKLNHKAFMQIVVLGGSSYVPFMRLTTTARREIIEDLLDIEVFSAMNVLAKEDLTELKATLDKNATTTTLLNQQITMAQSFETHIEEQTKERLDTINTAITETEETIEDLLYNREELVTSLDAFIQATENKRLAAANVDEYEKTLYKLESREAKVVKERTFYEDHDNCPTCEQSITEEFKAGRFATLTEKETGTRKAIVQCQGLIEKYQQVESAVDVILEGKTRIQANINTIDAKLPLHRRRLRELEQDKLKASLPPPTAPNVDVDALSKQLGDLRTAHTTLSADRVVLDAAAMLLKDTGIKTRIIKHYLPVINKHINGYLVAMDFPIQFTFDDNFEEHIKTHHGDSFAYEQFSDGEKKRIDLALLLTWRAVARLKNSASTNLLILDEVFDSSLDMQGMEDFIKIIHGLEADANVFVMSHRVDQMIDKFAHTIIYQKVRGFSEIKTT